MKTIFACTHQGFGDHVIFNGLIRTLAEINDYVFLPCKDHNMPSVEAMYMDNNRIRVIPVKDDQEAVDVSKSFSNRMMLGLFSGHPDACKPGWDKLQYDQAGVPFENRWSKFKIGYQSSFDSAFRMAAQTFIHDDPDRSMVIRESYKIGTMVYPFKTGGHAWPWLSDLESAAMVHVIDSAWLCIADSVSTVGQLFYHRYARPITAGPPTLRKNWTIID